MSAETKRNEVESLDRRIRSLPAEGVDQIQERMGIIQDGLNSLKERLKELPEHDRLAATSLLYEDVADVIFDFHLTVVKMLVKDRIRESSTKQEKAAALEQFRAATEDLKLLYNIP